MKLWLPINSTNTNDDAVLSRLITAVSMDFLRAAKRPDLLMASYIEVREGDGSNRMIAFHWPIVSISALTIGGAAITASSDKVASGYFVDQDIDPERVWNVQPNGYVFTDMAPVSLAYTAGYVQPGIAPSGSQIALLRISSRPCSTGAPIATTSVPTRGRSGVVPRKAIRMKSRSWTRLRMCFRLSNAICARFPVSIAALRSARCA